MIGRIRRIALCGLEVTNLGDRVIFDTAEWLLRDVLAELGLSDCTITRVPIVSDGGFEKPGKTSRKTRMHWKRRVSSCAAVFAAVPVLRVVVHAVAGFLLRRIWRRSRAYARFAAEVLPRLSDADLIVFSGGGMVKYHRQSFHYLVDEITAFADRRGLPVVFNAVGVEGYDAADPECAILANALRRKCVFAVTTRDDLDMLVRDYRLSPRLGLERVCDPAFWTVETYGVAARGAGSGVVGLNVIRPDIFGEYGRPVDEHALCRLYADLAGRIRAGGRRVVFFSNGALTDATLVDGIYAADLKLSADPGVSVVLPKTARELVETIAGFERFMSARLHSSIIGTVLGIPNVSLVWNRKQPLFGKQIGMEGNYIPMERVDAATVLARLDAAEPYAMDEDYKNSVRRSLKRTLQALAYPEGLSE